jgi:hypothetical protein
VEGGRDVVTDSTLEVEGSFSSLAAAWCTAVGAQSKLCRTAAVAFNLGG